jgi:hypothetical protein
MNQSLKPWFAVGRLSEDISAANLWTVNQGNAPPVSPAAQDNLKPRLGIDFELKPPSAKQSTGAIQDLSQCLNRPANWV